MVKMKFAVIAAMVLAAIAPGASAQQMSQAGVSGVLPDGKIAVINTQIFQSEIGELKQKYDLVDNQFKDRYQKLQTIEQQLKQLENDIRTKGPAMAPDKVQEMQGQYEDLKKRGTRDLEDLRGEYQKAVEVATRPVEQKLMQFMQNYAAQRGIVVVINLAGAAQTGSLAYWSPGADITKDFIAEYNKANPVAGAPASRPATQPAPTPTKPAGQKP